MALWSLRQRPTGNLHVALGVGGAIFILTTWWLLTTGIGTPRSVLPSPGDVFQAFPALFMGENMPTTVAQRFLAFLPGADTNSVVWHASYSIWLNLLSYLVAIVLALPIGYALGLWGPIRAMFEGELAVFRYAPITAFVGIFIRWYGIGFVVKVAFLAFGLIVYLIPAVVQRIDEVERVYDDTAKTCGGSRWQRIKTVFWPMVTARLSDDCRTLVPITWTYLIIAEGFNLSHGGLGALANGFTRQGRWDMVFAIVFIILAIGFAQDRIWTWIDRRIYKWKYV